LLLAALFLQMEYIDIVKIPITPSLYTNKMSESIKDAHSKKGKEKRRQLGGPIPVLAAT
jgi:hypothetical protein